MSSVTCPTVCLNRWWWKTIDNAHSVYIYVFIFSESMMINNNTIITHICNPIFYSLFLQSIHELNTFFIKKLTLTEQQLIRFGRGAAFYSSYGTRIATNSQITNLPLSNAIVNIVINWFDRQSFIYYYLLFTHPNYITNQFFTILIYIYIYII